MYAITEIIWPLIRRAQLYDQDILAVKIDFGDTGVYQIFQQNLVVEQLTGESYRKCCVGDAQYIKCKALKCARQ
jgi:hypothetical protein